MTRPILPPFLFPDVEMLLTGDLRARLATRWSQPVYVGNRMPDVRRDYMVTIRRDGGARRGQVDTARLGVNVWAPTDREANDLAQLVRALLASVDAAGTAVRGYRELSGPSWVADESGQPNRYMTAEVDLRGAALT